MGLSILFVDDDKNLLQGIGRVLKMERDDVDFSLCAGAEEAMELLRKKSFDALVTDYRMPDMDGISLLEFARGAFPGMKRVLMTGQPESETDERAAAAAQKFIAKPCDAIEIVMAVETLIVETK